MHLSAFLIFDLYIFGNYEISYDGINDEDNDPLPYSHYTMLSSDAEINDSKRRARIFLSSFPSGFNPAFYGENVNKCTSV